MMLSILIKPYPLYISVQRIFIFSLSLGVFVALFLMVFQPFGTGGHDFQFKYLFLAGYGAITSLVSLALAFLLKFFFVEEKWTVIRQILWFTFFLLLSAGSCYGYFISFFEHDFSWYNSILFLGYVFSIGILPISITTLLIYIYQLRRNQSITAGVNEQISKLSKIDIKPLIRSVTLLEENQKNKLVLNLEDLLFVKASSNYVELFLKKEDKVERVLFRGNLKHVEQQIENSTVVRCHRSYLVNLNNVLKTSGNAQGYLLHFDATAHVVPISRSKGKLILEQIRKYN